MSVLDHTYDWWIAPFAEGFMLNALVAGLLTVVATSVVGTWVVLRGMSFLGDALAHGVLPGIAIAFIFGVNTSIGAAVAAIAMILGTNLIKSHSPLPEDASIGVLFVGFLALAVVIMSSKSGSYVGDLNRFLFGSITGVDNANIIRQAVATIVTVVVTVIFYRSFLVMTFDESQAKLLGLRPGLSQLVLLVLVAGAIVTSFEAVGNLLVFAFLIAPPAAGTLVARRVPMIMATGILLGSISVFLGLLLSWHYGSAPSATMALCSVSIFILMLVVQSVRNAVGAQVHAA